MTPRPDQEKIADAHSETTGLLLTTYDSAGSLPIASSYGNLQENVEQQLQQTNKETSAPSFFRKRNAWSMLAVGCGLCALLIGVFFWHPLQGPPPSRPDEGHDHHHHRQGPVPGKTTASPFSDLDPVDDLGLPEVTREDDVAPPWEVLDPSMKSEQDHRNALPTNAWYQNLIVSRRGEPSNLQRAYPAPYLVDVVGMIPGLRAHVTHVESNDVVMQLSFNEDFGLVLGATKALMSGGDDNDDDKSSSNDNDEWKSHQYTISSANNLGVTLEWVSLHDGMKAILLYY